MSVREFEEIAHTGGTYSVETITDASGVRMVSVGYSHSGPTPASMFLLLALPQGIPYWVVPVGGARRSDVVPEAAAALETVQVMIASDKHGLFGHTCPRCNKYWRSDSTPARWNMSCAYCPFKAAAHFFRTAGQKAFVKRFCEHYYETLDRPDGKYLLDLDKIADEVAKGATAPQFLSRRNLATTAMAVRSLRGVQRHFGQIRRLQLLRGPEQPNAFQQRTGKAQDRDQC